MVGGVTPVVDLFDTVQGLLGDRFLKTRVVAGDPVKTGRIAIKATAKEPEIRKELYSLTMGFLNGLTVRQLEIDEETEKTLVGLASFTARARTAVVRDWRGTIQYMPQAEGIARIFKQLLKPSWALAAVLY